MADSGPPPGSIELRRLLAWKLADAGYVRSEAWRAAVTVVPRHEFVPEFFVPVDSSHGEPTRYLPVGRHDGWRRLALAYRDETLVTQLDSRLGPGEVSEPVTGIPTSSSTMPSLVVRMWEALGARDGDRVLEIGTGSGYAAALGSERLGDDAITSVEVDPVLGAQARAALDRAGYHPNLVVGDGANGHAQGAPYDRVIATCAWRSVPPAWVRQSRAGAVILLPLSGWLGTCGLASIEVTDPDAGTAVGRFVDPDVTFIPARSQAEGFVLIPTRDDDTLISQRVALVGPEVFADHAGARRIVQLATPNAQYLRFEPGQDLPEHLLVESDRSYASFDRGVDGRWIVQQGGQHPLWDRVEAAIAAWQKAGSPGLADFRIDISPRRQTVAFDSDHRWELPAA